MEHFNLTHLRIMAEGIRLFNAQKYWECHEDLEHHWLEEPGPIRNIYWAVIQVAASMIHYRDGNLGGAKSLLEKAKQKFNRCEQFRIENEILENNLSWKKIKALAKEVPLDPELLDFKNLFEFRFKDPKEWK